MTRYSRRTTGPGMADRGSAYAQPPITGDYAGRCRSRFSASLPGGPWSSHGGDGASRPHPAPSAFHASRPGLKLVKLGCPDETTTSMINGGICRYRGGSQLATAVAFLQAHRSRVLLVTLDIGANDPEHCGGRPGLGQLAKCAVTDIP